MSNHETMATSGKPAVGDECHFVPQSPAHDGPRRTQHFAHSGTALGPLLSYDYDIPGAHRAVEDGLGGALFTFEHARLPTERQTFLAGDLCDCTLRRPVPVQHDEVAVLFQRIGERPHDLLSSKIHARIC